jgi:hypothetical protein
MARWRWSSAAGWLAWQRSSAAAIRFAPAFRLASFIGFRAVAAAAWR